MAADTALIVFGATGDLTQRKLYPSLYHLAKRGLLPKSFSLYGVSRKELNDADFRSNIERDIRMFAHGEIDQAAVDMVTSHAHYLSADLNHREGYERLNARLKPSTLRLFYLALPPRLFAPIVENIKTCGLGKALGASKSRVIVEKPFGYDFATAKKLEHIVSSAFDEKQIFRIDHYLGKESVQNLLTFRAKNSVFEDSLNRNAVASIHIDALESVGLEDRGAYYDGAGSIRDMVQNHLLQLVAFLTMDLPAKMTAEAEQSARAKLLATVRPHTSKGAIVLGQYAGYKSEPNVNPKSTTDTYSSLTFTINNPRWRGVPVFIRTGKHLKEKLTNVTVLFKPVRGEAPNRLSFRLDPHPEISLVLNVVQPGFTKKTDPAIMHYSRSTHYTEPPIGDYERLLLAIMDGDHSLFVSAAEVLSSWKAVDPFLKKAKTMKPKVYSKGSLAP